MITESNKKVPKNIIHVMGSIKFAKLLFFGKGNLIVFGNHLTWLGLYSK
jgi:hypothetical protein